MTGTDLTDVVAHERALLDPEVRANPDLAGALVHPDFVEFGRSGRVWDRPSVLTALAKDPRVTQTFYDFDPRRIGSDTILLTYRGSDGTRHSSLWQLDAAGWRIRFHQATPPLDAQTAAAPEHQTSAASQPRSAAIAVLAVSDAQSSLQWYGRLGFVEEWRHRFAAGLPFYVGIARPDGARMHLSERAGDGDNASVVYLSVPDLKAAAAAVGVPIIDDMPWGQDVEVTDPDGNRVRIAQPDS